LVAGMVRRGGSWRSGPVPLRPGKAGPVPSRWVTARLVPASPGEADMVSPGVSGFVEAGSGRFGRGTVWPVVAVEAGRDLSGCGKARRSRHGRTGYGLFCRRRSSLGLSGLVPAVMSWDGLPRPVASRSGGQGQSCNGEVDHGMPSRVMTLKMEGRPSGRPSISR
jgi:hypothetical protein